MGTAGIFSLASIITITSLMWQTTALAYISRCVVSRLTLFYYPYLYGAGKTISSVSYFALSSPHQVQEAETGPGLLESC